MGHTTAELAGTIAALEYAARDAVLRLCSLLQAEDLRIVLRPAVAILDRTGHGPAQRRAPTATKRDPVVERADTTEALTWLRSGMEAAVKCSECTALNSGDQR